jgi:predicted metal-binding protein
MDKYSKYVNLAKKHGMIDALIISPSEIYFDIRTNLKCGWGCERSLMTNIKCDNRGTTHEERVKIVKQYKSILLIHSHEVRKLSKVILELEKMHFLTNIILLLLCVSVIYAQNVKL